jgi:hypothetical protein
MPKAKMEEASIISRQAYVIHQRISAIRKPQRSQLVKSFISSSMSTVRANGGETALPRPCLGSLSTGIKLFDVRDVEQRKIRALSSCRLSCAALPVQHLTCCCGTSRFRTIACQRMGVAQSGQQHCEQGLLPLHFTRRSFAVHNYFFAVIKSAFSSFLLQPFFSAGGDWLLGRSEIWSIIQHCKL